MEKLRITLLMLGVMLIFLTGFLSNYAVSSVYVDAEKPFLIGIGDLKAQPNDWINEKNIEVLQDKVVIHIRNAVLSRYADTGSMLPTLGEQTNGIKIKPVSSNQINIGDIITLEKKGMLIIHRVIAKGRDEKGVFFITKGDNNLETDGKVYFEDVKYVTIALIY